MKVADAGIIAHAMYFRFQLFLYHLMVMELVAILPVYQVDLAVLEADEVQEAPEVVDLVDHRELQDHLDVCWRRIIGIISSFVLKCNQLELTSQIFFPEHNKCSTRADHMRY